MPEMNTGAVDEHYMRLALEQARKAGAQDEVPVGAVVVCGDGGKETIIGTGSNRTRRMKDATAHAEMVALRRAAENLGHWHFEGCTVYVTIEPCVMCAGALVLSRVERLVFGALEPKFGGCGSIFDIVREKRLNHRLEVTGGVLESECAALMKEFFRDKR
ncbi:MAG: tRNA adenosine(34) deaminase TadA [Gemmatimonadota bacterium]|nr:tRNA adenosine(34) deaminase TadA [Gemmatimonadota bacterium]